jgi:DNA-directed RNA polymerase subunit F
VAEKSYIEKIREDIKKALIAEIEASTPERASEIILSIIFKGRQAGLTDEDMDEIREVFRKKIKEAV